MRPAQKFKQLPLITTPNYQGYLVGDIKRFLYQTKAQRLQEWLDSRNVILHGREELIRKEELEFFLGRTIAPSEEIQETLLLLELL